MTPFHLLKLIIGTLSGSNFIFLKMYLNLMLAEATLTTQIFPPIDVYAEATTDEMFQLFNVYLLSVRR